MIGKLNIFVPFDSQMTNTRILKTSGRLEIIRVSYSPKWSLDVTCFISNHVFFPHTYALISLSSFSCHLRVLPVSCGLTASLLWLAGRISSLTTSAVLASSCVASISEQCSVLVPSIDRRMSPTCSAPHLRGWDGGRLCQWSVWVREAVELWSIIKREASPFHYAGWLYLVDNDNLFAPVYCCGKADPQAGRGTFHDLHQQRARGLLHCLWNR